MKKGQIALIVLVISAVVMTVGLSLSRRSVIQTKITTDEELLKQAFNAAESGVDYYLGTGKTDFTASNNQSGAKVTVKDVGGGTAIVNLGIITLRNRNNYTWLVGHDNDGKLNMSPVFGATAMSICVDNGFDGSLKVDYFYRNGANYGVNRSGFNIVTANRVSGYSNLNPGNGSCSVAGMKSISLGLPLGGGNEPILLVVKPIGGDTKLAVSATGGNFPGQEIQISSTGLAGDLAGTSGSTVSRKVNVINQYQIPSFMLDAITATGNVLSN